MATVEEEGVLQYFPGGREGVQRRFGEEFRRNLKEVEEEYLPLFAEHCGGNEILESILKRDYSVINSRVVEYLSCAFNYDCDKGLGELFIPDDKKSELVQRMNSHQFVSVTAPVTEEGLFKIYLVVEALREL